MGLLKEPKTFWTCWGNNLVINNSHLKMERILIFPIGEQYGLWHFNLKQYAWTC